MTTIAIDHNSISADGRSTDQDGYIARDNHPKLRKENGVICAYAGFVSDCEELLNLVIYGDQPSRPNVNGNLLTIDKEIITMHSLVDGSLNSWEITPPYSMGSGSHFALSALDFNMNSREAVKYAMKRDSSTGGKITTIKYKKA